LLSYVDDVVGSWKVDTIKYRKRRGRKSYVNPWVVFSFYPFLLLFVISFPSLLEVSVCWWICTGGGTHREIEVLCLGGSLKGKREAGSTIGKEMGGLSYPKRLSRDAKVPWVALLGALSLLGADKAVKSCPTRNRLRMAFSDQSTYE
jgi:hypothetical protein